MVTLNWRISLLTLDKGHVFRQLSITGPRRRSRRGPATAFPSRSVTNFFLTSFRVVPPFRGNLRCAQTKWKWKNEEKTTSVTSQGTVRVDWGCATSWKFSCFCYFPAVIGGTGAPWMKAYCQDSRVGIPTIGVTIRHKYIHEACFNSYRYGPGSDTPFLCTLHLPWAETGRGFIMTLTFFLG